MPSAGIGNAATQSCMTLGGCAGLGVTKLRTNSFAGNAVPNFSAAREDRIQDGRGCDSGVLLGYLHSLLFSYGYATYSENRHASIAS